MKLINLIPLKEIDFKNQDQFDDYQKQHKLRPATKVTIAGKVTTAGQAAKDSEPTKGSSVFGKGGGSVFAKTAGTSTKSDKPEPKKSTNWSFGALSGKAAWVSANAGLRDDFVGAWADENLVDLNKVADAINDKKLKFVDVATAISGNSGNKYAKDIASKYSLDPKDFEKYPKKSQEPTNDIDGLTSHKDLDKFFKANKDKLDKKYIDNIEGEIGALKYLESDYKSGDADREEVDTAALEIQDLIKKAMDKGASTDNSDWMDDLDSIDTSDIKGKANPDSDSWKHDDVFGATFKDPKTGKTTTVGDAYDREDDSPAYQKAFAYVSKFDPDGEAVMGTKAYDDLQKNAAPKVQLPAKASKLNYKHAEALEKVVNSQVGLKGYVDTDENTDAIMYNASSGNQPTYTLYFGGNSDYNKPDEFRVSLLPTYGNDPSNIGNNVDKTFKTGDEAMKFMVDVAKKYKKELEMDDDKNESIKLSSILPKKYTK